ncbi:MAG: glycosyltransferase family 2 protein, partial [Hungatella sp.]
MINLVMIARNEERCLERCLKSVQGLVDEIILVDTGSTDRTKEIAASYGAKLYEFVWRDDFSAARNYALDQSDADWNLILDADEYLTEGSGADVQSYLQKQDHLGAIMIRNAYEDDHEISYGTNYTTRLLPRGVRYCGRIHEQADSHLPRIRLPWVFDHDGYLQPHKAERNLPILLEELRENPQDSYYLYHVASTLRESDGRKALPYYELFYQEVPDGANYRVRGVVGYLYTLMKCKEFEKALQLIKKEEENLSK